MSEEKVRTGFKVCRRKGYSKIVSAFGSLGEEVEYSNKFWTGRPILCGPLALFGRLCNAEHFIEVEKHIDLSIFLCEYVESGEKRLYTSHKSGFIPQDGTIFADRIKLIKRMNKF